MFENEPAGNGDNGHLTESGLMYNSLVNNPNESSQVHTLSANIPSVFLIGIMLETIQTNMPYGTSFRNKSKVLD